MSQQHFPNLDSAATAGWQPALSAGPTRHTVQQALYSSALTDRQAGYQLVAKSNGIGRALGREIVRWCPTHDSLCAGHVRALSCYPLDGDLYGIGYTTLAGDEYSGRRGECVATQIMVLSAEAMAAFGQQPVRAFEAARAAGHLRQTQPSGPHLPEFQLLAIGASGERSPVSSDSTDAGGSSAQPATALGKEYARLLAAHRQIAVWGVPRPLEYASKLFDALPQHLRRGVSFSAALRYSAQRPFRLLLVGDDVEERRQLKRVRGLAVLDYDATQ